MTTYRMKILILTLSLVGTHMAAGVETSSPLPWPAGVEAKIDEALAIKKDAFRKNRAMRLPGGAAGLAYGRCLDEVASALGSSEWQQTLLKAEHNDIKAKVALWALDRKRRPEEYSRIAAAYVDRGKGPGAKAARQFIGPRAVSPEDTNEEHRLVLEYAFFFSTRR